MEEIAEYTLDHNTLPPYRYYKAEKFRTEKEHALTRSKDWFINNVASIAVPHEHILKMIDLTWIRLSQAPLVATRRCNEIWNLYEKYPQDIDMIDETCRFMINGGDFSDFRHLLRQTFKVMRELKNRGLLTTLNDATTTQSPASISTSQAEHGASADQVAELKSNLHGADYYDQFNH